MILIATLYLFGMLSLFIALHPPARELLWKWVVAPMLVDLLVSILHWIDNAVNFQEYESNRLEENKHFMRTKPKYVPCKFEIWIDKQLKRWHLPTLNTYHEHHHSK